MTCFLKKSAPPARMVIPGGVSHFLRARNWVLLSVLFDLPANSQFSSLGYEEEYNE